MSPPSQPGGAEPHLARMVADVQAQLSDCDTIPTWAQQISMRALCLLTPEELVERAGLSFGGACDLLRAMGDRLEELAQPLLFHAVAS